MLEVAKRKKLYTRLFNQDLNKFLSARENSYDLINAADVFTYFGELGGLFVLLFDALKPGGRVLFSVSENPYNQDDYFLHLSGRFLHSRKYVEEGLKNAVLSLRNLIVCVCATKVKPRCGAGS